MGLLNKFFGKKEDQLPPFDLSSLKVDMHSHLIPGIDDGSRSMDETIAMLSKFKSLGIQKVITTPHIMSDYFRNTPEIILGGLAKVKDAMREVNLDIEIEAAAEYYFDETLMEKLRRKEKLLTFGDNHVLFEFSFHVEPPQIEKLFFELLTQNYKPVLAHFERYGFLFNQPEIARKWREQGILIQMNYNSLFGHYGPVVKKQAEWLVENQQIDFVSTDCHRMDHLMILEENLSNRYLHKLANLNLLNKTL